MFSIARKLDTVSAGLVAEFFARGGQVTLCPSRRAHQRNDNGWNRLNDETRREGGLAHD